MFKEDGMAVKMSGVRLVLFLIPLFFINIAIAGENGFSPVVNEVYNRYGDGFITSYIVSACPLWLAVAAALAGRMQRVASNKTLLIIGSALFAVGATFCMAINNPLFTAVLRSVMGFGEGMVCAVVYAYIAQMFVKEESHSSFTGIFNAIGMVIGAAVSYLAGMFALQDWTHAFWVYIPMFLVVVGLVLFVPDLGRESAQEEGESEGQEAASDKSAGLGPLFIPFEIDYVIMSFMYAVVMYYISLYIEETGIGDAALAGTLISISSIAGFLANLVFSKVYGKLTKSTSILCLGIALVGTLMLYLMPSAALSYIAIFLIGAGYGAYYTYTYVYVSDIVPASRVGDVIGYSTAIYSILFFATPYLVSALTGFVTGGSYVGLFLVTGILGAIAIAIEFLTNGTYKRLREQNAGTAEAAEA